MQLTFISRTKINSVFANINIPIINVYAYFIGLLWIWYWIEMYFIGSLWILCWVEMPNRMPDWIQCESHWTYYKATVGHTLKATYWQRNITPPHLNTRHSDSSARTPEHKAAGQMGWNRNSPTPVDQSRDTAVLLLKISRDRNVHIRYKQLAICGRPVLDNFNKADGVFCETFYRASGIYINISHTIHKCWRC